jgi:hypothetical protein
MVPGIPRLSMSRCENTWAGLFARVFLKWPTSRASGASVSCMCCPSGALRFQRHRTRATAQHHVCLRPGVEPAVWAGACGTHTGFPLYLPLPRHLCPPAVPPGDNTPLREEIRASLRARPATTSRRICWPMHWRAVTGENECIGGDFCEFA